MINSIRSEWVKLGRRNMLLGFGGAMLGFTLLFTILVFADLGGTDVGLQEGEATQAFASASMLSTSDGSVFAMSQVAPFMGIIALALFASNVAGEFGKGTIRTLFVTQPQRLRVVAGKIIALASFVSAWMAVTLIGSVATGALMAPGAGVDTASWWTAEGLAAIGTSYINLTAAALLPGLIGAALAALTRSSAIPISIGAAYFILGEALVSTFWKTLGEWGPSAAANVVALGGEAVGMMGGPVPSIGYTKATILAIAYASASILVTSTVLAKRDVTS